MYVRIYIEREDLRAAFAAVGAANELDMAAAVLVAATVPSLESRHNSTYTYRFCESIDRSIDYIRSNTKKSVNPSNDINRSHHLEDRLLSS